MNTVDKQLQELSVASLKLALTNFEKARKVLGHSCVLNQPEIDSVKADTEWEVLIVYIHSLKKLSEDDDGVVPLFNYWVSDKFSHTRRAMPVVEHTTCTGNTKLQLVKISKTEWEFRIEAVSTDQIGQERPFYTNGEFPWYEKAELIPAFSDRDLRLLVCTSRFQRDRGNLPTRLASLEKRLAALLI